VSFAESYVKLQYFFVRILHVSVCVHAHTLQGSVCTYVRWSG